MSTLPFPSVPTDSAPRDRAGVLADLRARIRRIEGAGGEGGRTLPFGVEAIDAHLPDGGLPLGCLHAVTAEDPGAGTGFAATLLGRLATPKAPAVWILRGRDLYAPGLAAYGLTPDRLVAVRAVRAVDALWAMEEALRCSALSAVLGELEGLDLTASRRLQLAAESSGVTGFLLDLSAGVPAWKNRRPEGLSAAVTRWRLDAAPSQDEEEDRAPRPAGGLPGLGAPRWSVALERCRGGRPGRWTLIREEEGWRDAEDPDTGYLDTGYPGDGNRWQMSDTRQSSREGSLSGHRPAAAGR